MAAASKKAAIDQAVVEELTAAARAVSDAGTRLERLCMGGRFEDCTSSQTPAEFAWLMQGFTDDLLLVIGQMARHALELRSCAMAGLTGPELDLLHAVGGEH